VCALAGVSRASYYRDWASTSPGVEETALRDRIQQLALGHRFYGYRRITELLRREGWCVNRKVVGWAMADHLRAELALEALEMALAKRQVFPGGLVHHSDRGIQYDGVRTSGCGWSATS